MPSDGERLYVLEQEMRRLQASVDQLSVRNVTSMPYKQTRLARAVAGPTAYPPTGDTFYIAFLDGTFPESSGDQTPSYTLRHSGTAFALAHNLSGSLPTENSEILVHEWNGQWWYESGTGGGGAPPTELLNWQRWSTANYWQFGNSASTLNQPDVFLGDGALAPVWADNASNQSETQSSGIFELDDTYNGAWVAGGNLICKRAGSYLFSVTLRAEAQAESAATPASMETVVPRVAIQKNNGSLAPILSFELDCRNTDDLNEVYQTGDRIKTNIAVDDRISITCDGVYNDGSNWGIEFTAISVRIHELKTADGPLQI